MQSSEIVAGAPNVEKVFTDWMKLSRELFPESSALTSVAKLKEETGELENVLRVIENRAVHHSVPSELLKIMALDEFSDCLMCLLDSVGKSGFTVDDLVTAFEKKMLENKYRIWQKNPDGTYSHV